MAPRDLRPLLALLRALYREGGVIVATPLAGARDRIGAMTLVQPDGGIVVRVAPELIDAPDRAAQWAQHERDLRARLAPLLTLQALVASLRVWFRWSLRTAMLGLVACLGTIGLASNLFLALLLLTGGTTLAALLARRFGGELLDWIVSAVLRRPVAPAGVARLVHPRIPTALIHERRRFKGVSHAQHQGALPDRSHSPRARRARHV